MTLNKNNDFYNGLISGVFAHIICNPLDVIRTNLQLGNKIKYNYKFLFRGFFSGLITIPSFWSSFFYSKSYLDDKNLKFKFINGYIAGNIASTITSPLWFIRHQNHSNKTFNIIKFYNKNGIYPFYNTLFNTYILNLSFLVQIPLYDFLKDNYSSHLINDTFKIFLISCLSKTIATSIFYPLDTIRTIKRNNYNKPLLDIIKCLNKNPNNYYSGIKIYLVRCLPYYSITFCTFEYLKNKTK